MNLCLGPPRTQDGREVPGPASEVDDRSRLTLYACDEIEERPRTIVRELQVVRRIPAQTEALSYWPASDISLASSPRRAMSWIESGKPSSAVLPAGIETAGIPAWFHCAV